MKLLINLFQLYTQYNDLLACMIVKGHYTVTMDMIMIIRLNEDTYCSGIQFIGQPILNVTLDSKLYRDAVMVPWNINIKENKGISWDKQNIIVQRFIQNS